MSLTTSEVIAFDKILNHILETELEDFSENPSNNHVYYCAVLVLDGKKEADKLLSEAIRDLELTKGE